MLLIKLIQSRSNIHIASSDDQLWSVWVRGKVIIVWIKWSKSIFLFFSSIFSSFWFIPDILCFIVLLSLERFYRRLFYFFTLYFYFIMTHIVVTIHCSNWFVIRKIIQQSQNNEDKRLLFYYSWIILPLNFVIILFI